MTTDEAPTAAPAEPTRPNPTRRRRRPRPTDANPVATVTLPTVEITPATADDHWPTPQMRAGMVARSRPRHAEPRKVPRRPRGPVVGLVGLLVFAPLAGFVAWVSADPFWLAIGHSQRGTATVTTCTGHGYLSRCTGTFTGNGLTGFTAKEVALTPVPAKAHQSGAQVSATMVSARGRMAYAGSTRALYLRVALGLAIVVLCGFAIAWTTGAARLPGRGARAGAFSLSVAAPLLLLAGIVATAR